MTPRSQVYCNRARNRLVAMNSTSVGTEVAAVPDPAPRGCGCSSGQTGEPPEAVGAAENGLCPQSSGHRGRQPRLLGRARGQGQPDQGAHRSTMEAHGVALILYSRSLSASL